MIIKGPDDISYCDDLLCSFCNTELRYPFVEYSGRRNACALRCCWACAQKDGAGLIADLIKIRALPPPRPSPPIVIHSVRRHATVGDNGGQHSERKRRERVKTDLESGPVATRLQRAP